MKNFILFLLLPVWLMGQSAMPDSTAAAQNIRSKYNCWVKFGVPQRTVQGIFIGATDSTVTFASRLFTPSTWSQEYEVRIIPAAAIKTISFRKRGSMVVGAAIGAGTAVATGAVLSQASTGGVTGEAIVLGTIAFGLPSAVIGTLIGSVKKKYQIDGRRENLARVRPALERYNKKSN